MADNVTLNLMSGGNVVASDDITSVHYQRIKLIHGADGVNAGDVSTANGLPVALLASTAAIGKLAANSGVDIGDVDVITMPNVVIGSGTVTTVSTVTNLSQLAGAAVPIGAGLEATAVRVTLPTDGTGVVKLGAGTAAYGKLAANSGVDIGDVDVTSIVPGVGATNLGKAEDAVSADGDTGVGILAVRKATPADTSGLDGDYEFLQMSAGRLWASATIDAALPAGTNAIGKLAANSGIDIGDVDILSIAAGTNAIGKLAANSGVDIGDVDITSIVPGTAATNLGKAEDAAHTSADTGVFVLAVRDDTIGPTSGTEGDYEALHTNENGALWIEEDVSTKGGWSVGNFTSGDTYTALTATAQVIKASAGKFGGYYIYNPNTAATYVMIYNIAAASVTVGTSTALLVFCIPASSGANLELKAGIAFGTAMSIAAATTGDGLTAPTTALEAMIFYK